MSVLSDPASRRRLVRAIVSGLVGLVVVVVVARWFRGTDAGAEFIESYPGETPLPPGTPVGFPWWLNFQHFLNAFFIVLIVRTGWQVRTTRRPAAYWVRSNRGLIRTKGEPRKISLDLWLHLTLDALWVVNGLIYLVLLFSTGQWARIVPTSWDVFPNAASAALQYASLDWPHENGWVNYNSLQQLSYFAIVFIAAPLAIVTGIRLSNAWPGPRARISTIYPLALARAIHLPTMVFFVLFVIVHVTLVLTTGALRNLGHMYAATDDGGWLGLIMFSVSLAVIVVSWFLAKPVFLQPLASIGGRVTRQ